MKKIRLLALLLALLMLPIGLLAACDDNKDPEPDPAPTPDDDEEEEIVYDDGSKTGYLMFFNFDAAATGDLNIKEEPYATFFDVDDTQEGIIYTIDKMQSKTKNSLLIARENSDKNATFSILLEGVKNLSAAHTLEFDMRVKAGCITDTIKLNGTRKGSVQTLIKISVDGIYDSNDAPLYMYEENADWINVALGIDDENGKYTLYVDGVSVASDIKFSNAYKTWTEGVPEKYTFRSEQDLTDFYFYLDNLGIVSGTKPMCYVEKKEYIDTVEDEYTVFDSSKENAKEAYFEKISTVFKDVVRNTPYADGAKLPLGDIYAMLRYNTETEKFAQITYEYGYEKGEYSDYGAVFGNKAFKADDSNWLYFKANGAREFVGAINGESITGVYSIEGTASAPEAIIKWGRDGVRYVTYNSATSGISVSETKDGTGKVYAAEPAATLPFGAKTYGYTTADKRVYFTVYEYLNKADLIIEGEGAATLIGTAYTYENGVLKIGTHEFTYAEGQFTYEGKTFGVLNEWELMDCEEYWVKYSNYKSNAELQYTVDDLSDWNYAAWDTFKVTVYVPDGMAGYSYGIYFDCSAEGSDKEKALVSYTRSKLSEGWNELSFKLSNLTSIGEATKADFNGKVYIKTSGVLNEIGVLEDGTYNGKAEDGFSLYISKIEFVETRSFVMEGPAEGKENCTHEGKLVPVDEMIEGGCFDHKYYVLKCSDCGATKLDESKGYIVAMGRHTYAENAEVFTSAPACTENGYNYVLCDACGERVKFDEIDATGHDYDVNHDATTNIITGICKTCGFTRSEPYVADALLSGVEKLALLGVDPETCMAGLVVDNGINDGTFVNIQGRYATSPGNLKLTTIQTAKGLFGIKIEQMGAQTGYIELQPKTLDYSKSFVFEISIMLGPKGKDDKYLKVDILNIYRGSGTLGQNFCYITEDGYFKTHDEKISFALSEDKFTNIAMHIDQFEKINRIYVDGKYVGEAKFDVSPNRIDGIDFIRNIRFLPKAYTEGSGSTVYINDFIFYEADEPVCVLGGLGGDDLEIEHSGDVALDDDGIIDVSGSDVRLDMPIYTVTTKYVLDFVLKGDFKDGAILTGRKLDEYRFENEYDLITVKDGYIYYLDMAICSVAEANTENGVRIALETNDKTGKTSVYVNGTAIEGGTVKYPASTSYYGAPESYIIGYIFKADSATEYKVEDFKMYTGVLVQD